MNKLKNRAAALFLCVVSVLVILTASLYIVDHAGHSCSNEDCAVCQVIRDFQKTIGVLGAGGASAAAFAVIVFFAEPAASQKSRTACFATPVTLRQCLLN
ncbi:MAG: hypothetical protein KBI35_06570 [Ruminococcus sp.]|nr:hypothetical protein [Ruminococcus sp.]